MNMSSQHSRQPSQLDPFSKTLPPWVTYLGIGFLCIISASIGGIFGYRIHQNTTQDIVATPSEIQTAVQTAEQKKLEIQAQVVSAVFWILPGNQPVCPESHAIKGAFQTSGVSYYYTSDSKQYTRVQPDICFATEEFARDIAGFVKKF